MKDHHSATVCILILLIGFVLVSPPTNTNGHADPIYKSPSAPIEKRVDDLVSRMTLAEKVSQMMNGAHSITRLDIPEYEWWNEALHGVARAGYATVFPQAIGLMSSRLRRAPNITSSSVITSALVTKG